VRETEILVEQQPPQGVFVRDDAGLVINKLSQNAGLVINKFSQNLVPALVDASMRSTAWSAGFWEGTPFFKNVQRVRETEIQVEQQPPQGVFICDHAGRVINKFSLALSRSIWAH